MPQLGSTPAGATAPRLLKLDRNVDSRGALTAAEDLPFAPVRYFVVRDVSAGAVRAQHALRRGAELLSCVAGACTVELRWHGGRATHRLDDARVALHVPPLVWVECREFSPDAVLLGLCSRPYEPADQIKDPDEFLAAAAA